MSKVSKLSFENETIYVGLDVHKKNWRINKRMGDLDLLGFSQDPNPTVLSNYFRKHYPGAKVKVAYEAGFSGFETQRSLNKLGIECIVVNAADVPSSDKDRKRKDDKRDARKLCRELANGNLHGIFIPTIEMEQARTLVRQRFRLIQDQTRCKNRIKHMVLFSGINLNVESERWSNKFVKTLEEVPCKTLALREALNLAIKEYKALRSLTREATLAFKKLSQQPPFLQIQPYIQSISGIGLINAMIFQTEIQDIHRFKTLDSLCDYAGLVPDISSSDEQMHVRGVTHRCNKFLRHAIIESSWMLIRKDPAMLMKYNIYCRRMNKNKAIIRIGKHLLARIRVVWASQKIYQTGFTG